MGLYSETGKEGKPEFTSGFGSSDVNGEIVSGLEMVQSRLIAVVVSEMRAGGMERIVIHLAESYRERQRRCLVLCTERAGILSGHLEERKIPFDTPGSSGARIRTLWEMHKVLKQFSPSIIHIHDYASLPYVVLANLCAGRGRLVFTAHGLLYEGFEPLRKRLRFFSRFLDGISAVSEKVAERHREFLGWNRPIPVIANGVPAAAADEGARQRVRGELGCSGETHLFLAVGNPRPEKGFEDLLEAAALLRLETDRFLVAIAGTLNDSGYCRDLMARLRQLNLEDFCLFSGFRQDTALYALTALSFQPAWLC